MDVSLDNLKNWNDLKKYIKINDIYTHDFLCFKKIYQNESYQYILLSKSDCESIQNQSWSFDVISKSYLNNNPDLDFGDFFYFNHISSRYPAYYILQYLFQYRNDYDTYSLLLFGNALYHIKKNNYYNWFKCCKNYNETFIRNTIKHLLKICDAEIESKIGISQLNIYRQTKKYFSPIYPIESNFVNNIDISNVYNVIEYINYTIRDIFVNYYFVAIYFDR